MVNPIYNIESNALVICLTNDLYERGGLILNRLHSHDQSNENSYLLQYNYDAYMAQVIDCYIPVRV